MKVSIIISIYTFIGLKNVFLRDYKHRQPTQNITVTSPSLQSAEWWSLQSHLWHLWEERAGGGRLGGKSYITQTFYSKGFLACYIIQYILYLILYLYTMVTILGGGEEEDSSRNSRGVRKAAKRKRREETAAKNKSQGFLYYICSIFVTAFAVVCINTFIQIFESPLSFLFHQ